MLGPAMLREYPVPAAAAFWAGAGLICALVSLRVNNGIVESSNSGLPSIPTTDDKPA